MIVKNLHRWFILEGWHTWPGGAAWGLAVLIGLLLLWLPLSTAVAIVVGLGLLFLIIIQPLSGLALALLAGPFGALEQIVFNVSALDSGQLLLLLTFAAWIARGLARRRINLPPNYLTLPFAIMIGVSLLSLPGAASIELGLRELLKWIEMLIIVWLVVDLGFTGLVEAEGNINKSSVGGPPRALWIILMLLLAGISQALIGIWQFGFRADGPEHFLVLERFYRAYGTFEQPNPFGGFMNLSALLAIGILIGLLAAWLHYLWAGHMEGRNQRNKPGADRRSSLTAGRALPTFLLFLFVAFAAAVTSLALLLSWSRGAWLGFAAGLAAIIFFLPRKRFYGALLVGIGITLFLILLTGERLPPALSNRITSFAQDFRLGDVRGVDINDDNYAVLERQAHWQAGLEMLNKNMLLGVGFGNYAAAYPDYALLNWPDPLGHAHNYYINLLAEMGVLGLIAYLLFWSAVLWQTIRALGALEWPGRGVVLGLMGVWIALAAHQLVDKLFVNNIYIYLGVLLGLLQLMDLQKSRNPVIENKRL